MPSDREDGREPGEAGGVPVRFFFPVFFCQFFTREREGERSHTQLLKKINVFSRHLSLSTNSIDRIAGLSGLSRLCTLSLGRNLLRSLAGVEVAAGSLEELWVSYNSLDKLVSFFFLFLPFFLFSLCLSLSLVVSPHTSHTHTKKYLLLIFLNIRPGPRSSQS